jgi:hypothetical protein
MSNLISDLSAQMIKSNELDAILKANMASIGFKL